MEDGLQEFNTRVNEAKATGEKIKELCVNKCKELENKLLYAEVYQRRENLRFYGIEETDGNENSLKVLQSFLERQCGIEPGIEFQRVHRIGNPRRDGLPHSLAVMRIQFHNVFATFVVSRRDISSVKFIQILIIGVRGIFDERETS